MTFYIGTVILTELLMAAMAVHVFTYSGFDRVQKKWFLMTFLAIMLNTMAEYLALEFNDHGPAWAFLLTIITAIQFSVTPVISALFAGALGMRREAKTVGVIFLIHAVIELISIKTGWIFTFDSVTGHYSRGQFYTIYEAFFTVSLIFLIISLIVVGRRFQHRDRSTVIMILIILIVSIISLLVYRIYCNYLGIALSSALCYIYYNDLTQQDIKEKLVAEQEHVSGIQQHIIYGLANLIESRNASTNEHARVISKHVNRLAKDAKDDGVYADQLGEKYIDMLTKIAPMYDIGKIVVSDKILKKPGCLTADEFESVKRHAAEGGNIVREVLGGMADESYIELASDIATYHHEHWDGSGYPEGLSGEDIPLSARIMVIIDVYDALISDRCYRKSYTKELALQMINSESGTHFDPKLVKVFIDHKEDFL